MQNQMWSFLSKLIRGKIAFGFFCAGVFWLAVLGWAASFAPDPDKEKACYQAAAKTGSDTEKCKTLWERTTTDPVALFTFVLSLATIKLWIATLSGIRRQSNETKILQRAYIGAEPGGVSPFLPRDLTAARTSQTFVGHAAFRNAERLPARNVQWYIDAEYTTDANYEPIRFGQLTGNNVTSPGEAMTQGSIEKDIPQDRGYFFVWGKIIYDDGFGKERKTVFCHRYNCRRLERDNDFFSISSRYGRHHDKGNDAT
jgi:hypothetical protein